jgi:tetratricopeptide (TPR) repeat protein
MKHLLLSSSSWFALLLMLALTGLVYWPGLSGGFLFDDTINITENPKVLINSLAWTELRQAANSFSGGGLGRPISMLSLGINHALTGLDPFYLKLTNLAIHVLCGIGLWLLTRLLLTAYRLRHNPQLTDGEIQWLSVAISAAWLLHPFNLTSVLYIVQRMASLAALFMIFGLTLYAWGRMRQLRGQHGAVLMGISVVVFGALAAFSKENGVLLPLLIFLTEWLIFGFQAPDPSTRRFVIGFNEVVAIIPSFLALGYLIIHFDWLVASYGARDFTLSERLLTQARVIWFYLQMILLPNSTQMGLYHDDIVLSTGWLAPPTTLPAMLGIIALLAGAIALRRRAPLLTFGILFFFAGHALESTFLPLEIAHEHRNYLPMYGLILVVIYYLGYRAIRERLSLRLQTAFMGVLILALVAGTAVRASYWANDLELALVEARHHPNSARTNMQAGYLLFDLADRGIQPEINFQNSRNYLETAWRLDPNNLNSAFGLLVLDDRQQRPVHMELLDQLADKLMNRPLAAASINALLELGRCQNEKICKLRPELMNRLFQSILNNPTLGGRSRAQVLTELVQFMILQGDLETALQTSQKALEIDPKEPQINLNHAHLLIHSGQLDAARRAIDQARALDRDGLLSVKIQAQEKLLANAISNSLLNPHPR